MRLQAERIYNEIDATARKEVKIGEQKRVEHAVNNALVMAQKRFSGRIGVAAAFYRWRPGGASVLRQKYTFEAEVNKVTWQLGRARAMLFIAQERQVQAALYAAMKIWVNHHMKFAATAHCKLLQGMRLQLPLREGPLLSIK